MLPIYAPAHDPTFDLATVIDFYNPILTFLVALDLEFLKSAVLKEYTDAESIIVLVLVPENTEHLFLNHVTECLIQVYVILAFFDGL